MPRAYYNEINREAAAWLRELIACGEIAPGDVDERSITDIVISDLRGYTQCHFFAGIGVWSAALRAAGWRDDRPVWTGSCPCQPFSVSGKRGGFEDERHLWPEFFRLIHSAGGGQSGVERPAVVFGEQVASKAGRLWLDTVSADLEGAGYAIGTANLCAAGIGAPHIRQRLYWVADAHLPGSFPSAHAGIHRGEESAGPRHAEPERFGAARGLGITGGQGLERHGGHGDHGHEPGRFDTQPLGSAAETSAAGSGLAHADVSEQGRGEFGLHAEGGSDHGSARHGKRPTATGATGATRGFWANAEWIACRDGKARPTEPGTFPLAYGTVGRVGRLRGYGNAIVKPLAEAFISSYMELGR